MLMALANTISIVEIYEAAQLGGQDEQFSTHLGLLRPSGRWAMSRLSADVLKLRQKFQPYMGPPSVALYQNS